LISEFSVDAISQVRSKKGKKTQVVLGRLSDLQDQGSQNTSPDLTKEELAAAVSSQCSFIPEENTQLNDKEIANTGTYHDLCLL
jgi:hypothetical protein